MTLPFTSLTPKMSASGKVVSISAFSSGCETGAAVESSPNVCKKFWWLAGEMTGKRGEAVMRHDYLAK